jgi:hypothetical protein
MHVRPGIVLMMSAAAISGCGSTSVESLSKDDYEVYQAVISTVAPHLEDDFVLLDSTTPTKWPAFQKQLSRTPESFRGALENFLAASEEAHDVSALASLGYRVVDADSFRTEGLKAIKERRVPIVNSVTVSPIGFDAGGSKAVVFCGYSCGNMCGSGQLYFLVRESDGWVVEKTHLLFVS